MSSPLDRAIGINKHFIDDQERDAFIRRLKRSNKRSLTQYSVEEFFENALRVDMERSDIEPDDFPFSVAKLEALANQHPESKTVMGLLESALCCIIGSNAMDRGDFVSAASAFADVYRKKSMVMRWEFSKIEDAVTGFHGVYSNPSIKSQIRAEAFFVHANILFLKGQHLNGLELLSLAQQTLPEDPYFPAVEGCILAMLMKKVKALKAFEKAANFGCDDLEHTLFHQAVIMDPPMLGSLRKTFALLEKFVDCAEPDSRKLPEACYRLAIIHGLQRPLQLGRAKRYYERGERADQERLLVFEDEAKEYRLKAGALVKKFKYCENPECSVVGRFRCTACEKVFYCSKNCQRTHWPCHKVRCKKNQPVATKKRTKKTEKSK